MKSIENYKNKLDGWYENIHEDAKEKLKAEKEVLGYFISQHPMDTVTIPKTLKSTPINCLRPNATNCVVAYVSDFKELHRKSDGKPFASFDIEDKTGKIKAMCYSDAYEVCGDLLENDKILVFKGKNRFNERDDAFVFSVTDVEPFIEEAKTVSISCPNLNVWKNNEQRVLPYSEQYGDKLVVFIEETGTFLKTDYLVSKDIVNANFGW